MAERGRGGRAGRRGGRGGRHGVVNPEDDEQRFRDLRDIEFDERGRRIIELERQLAEAKLGNPTDEDEESERSSDEEEFDDNPFGVLNQGVQNRGKRSNQNFGMKIEIPEFEGKAHPDEFIDWLHTVERVFDLKDLTDEQKVKLVAIKLRKHASIWWKHVKKQRARDGTIIPLAVFLLKSFKRDHLYHFSVSSSVPLTRS